jgi:hypothetical protein
MADATVTALYQKRGVMAGVLWRVVQRPVIVLQ